MKRTLEPFLSATALKGPSKRERWCKCVSMKGRKNYGQRDNKLKKGVKEECAREEDEPF